MPHIRSCSVFITCCKSLSVNNYARERPLNECNTSAYPKPSDEPNNKRSVLNHTNNRKHASHIYNTFSTRTIMIERTKEVQIAKMLIQLWLKQLQ